MMKKLFAAAMMLVLCVVTLSGMAAMAVESEANAVNPEYKITVNGLQGTITRTNSSTTVYEDMFIRYAVGFDIEGELFMMLDLIDVKWDDAKEGISGTFRIPKIQTSGKCIGECFMLTTDDCANQKPISDIVPNTYGILVQ